MASERQIAANKQNALKSTGPRTEAGKSRSAQNAYKHGLSRSDASAKIAAKEIVGLLQSEYPSASPVLLAEVALATLETRRARKVYAEVLNGLANIIVGGGDRANVDVSALDKTDRYVHRAQSRKTRLMRQLKIERAT